MINGAVAGPPTGGVVDRPAGSGAWRAAQFATLVGAVGVVALLVWRPAFGLWLTWDLLIPLVPAVLLIAPQLWRNLCPIATVHQVGALRGRTGGRRLPPRVQRRAPAVAVLLLFAIVPLRLVLFNEHGPALAAFVVAVLVVALWSGLVVTGKAGWCATFCPVLPVERLYGQAPLVPLAHGHCRSCTGCVRECYDLAPAASLHRLIGPPGAGGVARSRGRAGMGLERTPMGLFALAFPGFIAGYFFVPDSPSIAQAYTWALGGAALSIAVLTAGQRVAAVRDETMIRLAAALAIGVYYWFTVPAVAEGAHELLALPDAPSLGIAAARTVTIAVAGVWLVVATRRARAARTRA